MPVFLELLCSGGGGGNPAKATYHKMASAVTIRIWNNHIRVTFPSNTHRAIMSGCIQESELGAMKMVPL